MNNNITTADFIIIGGGIAGASAAYELCQKGRVIILEKESQAGYHTTGRSSAIFQKSYNNGDPLLNILVTASEDFLNNPPKGFSTQPLLLSRDILYIAEPDTQVSLDDLKKKLNKINIKSTFITGEEACRLLPLLSPEYKGRVLREQGTADMDVNALHEGYLQTVKDAGGKIITKAEVTQLTKAHSQWHVTTARGEFKAPTIINAAGAWVDHIAHMADIDPISIQPLRRTVIMVSAPKIKQPNMTAFEDWPMVMDPALGYYFKPSAGKILMTPGDETLSPPSDVQPEEIDIAYAADFLEKAMTMTVKKIDNSWAGLRNQVDDGYPVVGFAPEDQSFFWLAAQGGFGIKTAPALGRIAAALITEGHLPQDVKDLGLRENHISPSRLK